MLLNMLSLKYLLLCCMLCCIKGQVANPYQIEVVNVTMRSGNRANVALQIVNTNPSFQPQHINLQLTVSNRAQTSHSLNISSLGSQTIRTLNKEIHNLEQDKRYTVTLSAFQTGSGPALQPATIRNTFMTTNVQSVSIYDNPESCRLTVSCHFARQSKANGCRVNLDSLTSNNTVPVSILISRNDNRELVASSSLSGLQYMSLERDEVYTAECYGVRNGMRLDQLEASSEFELTGNIATERCSVTSAENNDLFLKVGLPIILTAVMAALILILVAVMILIVKQKRKGKRNIDITDDIQNGKKTEFTSDVKKSDREGESDSPQPEYIEVLPDKDSNTPTAQSSPSPSPSPPPPVHGRKEAGKEEESENGSDNDDAYENIDDYLSASKYQRKKNKNKEKEENKEGEGETQNNMYVNVGASNIKQKHNNKQATPKPTTPKPGTPTGLAEARKEWMLKEKGKANKGGGGGEKRPTSDVDQPNDTLLYDVPQRQSMPPYCSREGGGEEEEYIDMVMPSNSTNNL